MSFIYLFIYLYIKLIFVIFRIENNSNQNVFLDESAIKLIVSFQEVQCIAFEKCDGN